MYTLLTPCIHPVYTLLAPLYTPPVYTLYTLKRDVSYRRVAPETIERQGVGVPPTVRKDCSKVSEKSEKGDVSSSFLKSVEQAGVGVPPTFSGISQREQKRAFSQFSQQKDCSKARVSGMKPLQKAKDEKEQKSRKRGGVSLLGVLAQT